MGILAHLRDRYLVQPVAKRLTEVMTAQPDGLAKGSVLEVQTWAQPLNFNSQMMTPRKLGGALDYAMLRNMAQYHETTRACINIRKRQMEQLKWDIVPINEKDKDKFKQEIPVLKAYFATIGGYNVKFRHLLSLMVEDYLVIDGVALYKRRLNNGALIGLIPIDAATIKLRVDSAGMTPLPPAVAYEQWINGAKVAELTAQDLIYSIMNPRTHTPYGLSPVEELILVVEAALKAAMFNVSYFTDGSIPAGFYELPEGWNTSQIKEFQEMFDTLLSGDPHNQRKVKFMPASNGKGWQPAQAFDFKNVEPYLKWLTTQTAAMFGVMPQELGLTETVNRATAEEETEVTKRNSFGPMATFIAETLSEILWKEPIALLDGQGGQPTILGPFPELQFKFMDLDSKDELRDAEINERMIKLGAKSVDEWRQEQGLEPIGLGQYVLTGAGPILVKDVLHPPAPPTDPAASGGSGTEDKAVNTSPQDDIKRWEKKALNDFKTGRPFRQFESEVLDDYTKLHLAHDLQACTTREAIRAVFADYQTLLEEGVTRDLERTYNKLDAAVAGQE